MTGVQTCALPIWWEGFDLDKCYAYSDSASDLPMMSAVGHPVAVNPDGALERHARQHGWPVVDFHETTRAVARITTQAAVALALLAVGFLLGRHKGVRPS